MPKITLNQCPDCKNSGAKIKIDLSNFHGESKIKCDICGCDETVSEYITATLGAHANGITGPRWKIFDSEGSLILEVSISSNEAVLLTKDISLALEPFLSNFKVRNIVANATDCRVCYNPALKPSGEFMECDVCRHYEISTRNYLHSYLRSKGYRVETNLAGNVFQVTKLVFELRMAFQIIPVQEEKVIPIATIKLSNPGDGRKPPNILLFSRPSNSGNREHFEELYALFASRQDSNFTSVRRKE